jgi:hypothetical protein
MKRLIIMLQTQGGVGKTTWLAALIGWLKTHPAKPRIAAYDPDMEKGTLGTIFGPQGTDPLVAPHSFAYVDWRSERNLGALDEVVNVLASDAADVSVLDGVANQITDVCAWLRVSGIYETHRSFGVDVTVVICVDESKDAANCATRLITEIGGKLDVLLVRNEKTSPNPLRGGRTLEWDRTYHGMKEHGVEIPRFYDMTMPPYLIDLKEVLDGAGNGGRRTHLFRVAEDKRNSLTMNRARSYCHASLDEAMPWLEGLSHRFSRLAPILLPEAEPAPAAGRRGRRGEPRSED